MVRRQGGRVTSSRRLLLSGPSSTREGRHRTVADCAAPNSWRPRSRPGAPEVHLSTIIYRNLDELERLGASSRPPGPRSGHLPPGSSAHGHFVCEGCGTMIEAPDELFGGLARVATASSNSRSTRITSPCSDAASTAGERTKRRWGPRHGSPGAVRRPAGHPDPMPTLTVLFALLAALSNGVDLGPPAGRQRLGPGGPRRLVGPHQVPAACGAALVAGPALPDRHVRLHRRRPVLRQLTVVPTHLRHRADLHPGPAPALAARRDTDG